MRSKKYQKIKKQIDKFKACTLDQAIDFLQTNSSANFDETIEVHIQLGIDPRKTEQQVRGTVVLPQGTVKKKRIAAFVSPVNEKQAKEAGAYLIGGVGLIEKIKATGKCDFDIAIAEPEMMRNLAQIAKILGPKGLMPNPKSETVTTEIKKVITEIQKGKITFKNDAGGNLHQAVGRISWSKEKVKDNIEAFLTAVKEVKPSKIKGAFIKGFVLASTMCPGIKVSL